MAKTIYYANLARSAGNPAASRHISTVSPEQAIQNARKALYNRAKRLGLAVDAGEPHWMSGCLTWRFSTGFMLGGEVCASDFGDYTYGGEVWMITCDSSYETEV